MPANHTLLLVLLLVLPSNAEEVRPPEGFAALFNGKDLTGWHGQADFDPYRLDSLSVEERKGLIEHWTEDAKKHWKAESGELRSDGGDTFLTSDRDFGDVELRAEGKGEMRLFYSGLPLRLLEGEDDQWHRLQLVKVGERITLTVDGKEVRTHSRMENGWNRKLPVRLRGQFQLKPVRGGRWRNLFVREIPPAEANTILRKYGNLGFRDVFNGKDFTGWAGPVDNYEVKEGAIVCRPKEGGNIFTKEVFSDFVARVEYRLPPAGNNGLAIRYPGKGQPSVDAMCEVQILDDTAPAYRKLDPRQYNGSVYGMVPAHRGYLRPLGEWNFIEVTVRGPTIVVELNGTRIVDADVSKVTEFMGKHPGKDRLSGHFGFCGHNDPVAFRNIQIKSLAPVKP
jgi:hypothetical protein